MGTTAISPIWTLVVVAEEAEAEVVGVATEEAAAEAGVYLHL